MILILLVLSLGVADGDTYTVALAFEKMHCDECKAEIEAIVKKIQGFKSADVSGETVTVVFDDGAPIPAFNRLPKDLKLRVATITVSGTVSFTGDKATLVAKGSGASLALANPDPPQRADKLAELKKLLGGKNRFQITGTLAGGKAVVLETFSKTDWKDK